MTTPTVLPAPASRPRFEALAPSDAPARQEPLPFSAPVAAAAADRVPDHAHQLGERVARTLCEAVAGRRPLSQVRPLVNLRVWRLLEHLGRVRATARFSPASVRVQVPRPGVVEVTVRLTGDGRAAATAFRLERGRGGWTVTELECALVPGARRPARA